MIFKLFNREVELKTEIVVSVAVLLAVLAGIAGYYLGQNGGQVIVEKAEKNKGIHVTPIVTQLEKVETGSLASNEAKKNDQPEIKVDVVGCVKNPGVVSIKKGQILEEAINAAGGFTDEADVENINRAYILKENVKIKVKSKLQSQVEGAPTLAEAASVNGVEIISDSGGAVVAENSVETSGASGKVNSKININTASIDELDTLTGIGKESAKDIVAYREKNGGFKSISDIMNITGIKQAKFEKIKDMITVD